MKPILCVGLVLGSACANEVDPPWQLDHDRIVAVRATPPRLPAGTSAQLELLVAHAGALASVQPPDEVTVLAPTSMAGTVHGATVTAPAAAALDQARVELGVAANAPVPVTVSVRTGALVATKTVWLGDQGDNPPIVGLEIDGAPPADALVIAPGVDVPLAVTADDRALLVTWLTSCGTLHDFDLHEAKLRVEPDDPHEGELTVVVRDLRGGVSWRVWPVRAE